MAGRSADSWARWRLRGMRRRRGADEERRRRRRRDGGDAGGDGGEVRGGHDRWARSRRRARSRSASSSTCRRSASRTRRRARSRASTSRWARPSPTKLGVEPKFIEAISDNRIPFLEDGTADLILSTMTINEERVGQIDFSDPYFIARGRVLVPGDSDITGVDDLAGKNVCTALGSTYEANLKKQAPEAKLKLVDSYSECLELIQNGAVDAVSTDDVILTGMIIQDDTLKLVGDQLTQEPYGAGIKKGDTEIDRRSSTASFAGVQGRRHVDEALRQVGRPVHGRARRAADDHGRRGRRAGQEATSAIVACVDVLTEHLARVPLGLLGHRAPRGGLVRDRHGRRHARGGAADRAQQVAAAPRRHLRRGVPQHPAAGAAVHLLRRPAPRGRGHQRRGWRAPRRLGLYTAAYVAEALRSGVFSVGKGQIEASLSLGFTYAETLRRIVLPQAFRTVISPLGLADDRDDQELGDHRRLAARAA